MKTQRVVSTYLAKLVVVNAKSFKGRHELDLCTQAGRPSPWTLIVGENGVGKTTLLQCIAATIPHKNIYDRDKVAISSDQQQEVRFILEAAGVVDDSAIKVLARERDTDFAVLATYAKGIRLGTKSTRKVEAQTFEIGFKYSLSHAGDPFEPVVADEGDVPEPLVLAYGAGRRMGLGNLESKPPDVVAVAAFADECELVDAEQLIEQLDYAALKSRSNKTLQRQRRTFLKMLARMLPDVDSERSFRLYGPSPVGRSDKTGVYVTVPYGEVPLKQLSFGYQTMTAWLADIAWRLLRHYPNSSDPLSEAAIVLVDEIDLHLHPRWQRELQKLLAEYFPAVQFIATAHSPLMAQAAIGMNLAVVQRDGDTACIHNDPAVVANWRIDQVVASELFGLAPWSPDVQDKLDEQSALAQKADRTPKEE